MTSAQQVRLLRGEYAKTGRKTMVAMKAGVNFRAAVKYLETTKMPSDMKKLRHWRTRNDPFAAVWLEVTALFSAKQYAGTLPD